jgi:hypothetical protein
MAMHRRSTFGQGGGAGHDQLAPAGAAGAGRPAAAAAFGVARGDAAEFQAQPPGSRRPAGQQARQARRDCASSTPANAAVGVTPAQFLVDEARPHGRRRIGGGEVSKWLA